MAGFERNVGSQKLVVFAFDTTTGAAKTGDAANITVFYKELGGSVTALDDGALTEASELSSTDAPGYYEVDILAGELDTPYTYFFPKSSTANVGVVTVMPAFTIPAGFSAGTGQVALATGGITSTTFAAGAITATVIATDAIDADAIAADAITAAKIADGAIDAATFAAGAITAAAIATDAIDDDALSANAVTAIQSGLSTLSMSTSLPGSPTADTLGEALKNASIGIPASAPGAAGGLPLYDDLFSVVAEGTLATVTNAGQMTLSAGFNANDDFYNGMFLVPQDGPAAFQPRAISDYVGSSKTCTFTGTGSQLSRPFSVAPEAGDSIKILGLSGTV